MSASGASIRIDKVSKIPEGLTAYRRKRHRVAVFKEDGKIVRVFKDNCPHNERIMISDAYKLIEDSEGVKITCEFHGACFNLDDGTQVRGPGRDDLVLYTFEITPEGILVFYLAE